MPVSIHDFWKLATNSGLLSAEECQKLQAKFATLKGASQANALSLAEWLIASGTLTRYQASLLAAGRPGPFVFGDFVVQERIEGGRLTGLYRAKYKGNQRVLVVFVAQLTTDPAELARVGPQLQAASAIKNQNVARVHGAVPHATTPFVVVQELLGQSLRESLSEQPGDWRSACRTVAQAATGLAALHAANLAHGQVCPVNLWVEPNANLRLLQYPLVAPTKAKDLAELPMADYAAPELIGADPAASFLGDIYSLGCTLFELITGRVPFAGSTAANRLERHRNEVPPALDQVIASVPPVLVELVATMLHKEPHLRPQSAAQVAETLAKIAVQAVPGTPKPGLLSTDPRDNPAFPPARSAASVPEARGAGGQGAKAAPAAPVAEGMSPNGTVAASASRQSTSAASGPARNDAGPADDMTGPENSLPAEPTPFDDDPFEHTEVAGGELDGDNFELPDTFVPRRSKPQPTQFSRQKWIALAAGALAVGAIIIALAIYLFAGGGDSNTPLSAAGAAPNAGTAAAPDDAPTPNEQPSDHSDRAASLASDAGNGQTVVATNAAERAIDDDGQTLWISPTSGPPLTLDYVPSGAQVFLVLRPAELLAAPEGPKCLDALGPAGAEAVKQLRSTLGVELTQIEQLTIAFFPDESGLPQTAYVVRPAQEQPTDKWLAVWNQPTAVEVGAKKIYRQGPLAYYLPEEAAGRVAVVAPVGTLRAIVEAEGPPLMRKGIERLLKHSDAQRHVTLLFTPSYLLTDGKTLLAGTLEKLRDPLAQFLDESIEAVLFSAHLGEDLFLEMRLQGAPQKPPQALATLVRQRLDHIPETLESYLATLSPHPYGKLVVNRFPRMVQLLADQTRSGVDDQQALLRCYLPGPAAHNLLFGAELTLAEVPSTAGNVPSSSAPPAKTATAPAMNRSAAEKLRQKASLSFPREAFDRVIESFAKDIDLEIVILGADLQAEGIAKNKSLNDFDERDQPAGEILKKVLHLVSPEDKLVYVIRPAEGGRDGVVITTRAAAARRDERLPAEFDVNSLPKTR